MVQFLLSPNFKCQGVKKTLNQSVAKAVSSKRGKKALE